MNEMNLALYLEMKYVHFPVWHFLYLKKNQKTNYIKLHY